MPRTRTIPNQLTSDSIDDNCGPATGVVVTTAAAGARRLPANDPLTQRTRLTWASGDFGRIATGYAASAAAFVDRLALRRGETVLDVACGTGNLTLPAARAGAAVIGVDIAPNLIEAARASSIAQKLAVRFDDGDAESLPYADASFQTVMSMFGVMFAPAPRAGARRADARDEAGRTDRARELDAGRLRGRDAARARGTRAAAAGRTERTGLGRRGHAARAAPGAR